MSAFVLLFVYIKTDPVHHKIKPLPFRPLFDMSINGSQQIQLYRTAYRNNNKFMCYLSNDAPLLSLTHTYTNVTHADMLIELSLFFLHNTHKCDTRKTVVNVQNKTMWRLSVYAYVWSLFSREVLKFLVLVHSIRFCRTVTATKTTIKKKKKENEIQKILFFFIEIPFYIHGQYN